jgi:L-arabinose isomerase
MKARPCRLNQVTVKLEMQAKTFIEKACEKGIGHHLNVVRGHWSTEIRQTADFLNMEYIEINDK